MKNAFLALALVAAFAVSASAAEPVSKSALSSMGLGSMQQMSDNDGLAVRGKGTFAGVWGSSTAAWSGGQLSNNNYEAGASWAGKSSTATGKSFSFAGLIEAAAAGDPTGSGFTVNAIGGFSGGSSFARAR